MLAPERGLRLLLGRVRDPGLRPRFGRLQRSSERRMRDEHFQRSAELRQLRPQLLGGERDVGLLGRSVPDRAMLCRIRRLRWRSDQRLRDEHDGRQQQLRFMWQHLRQPVLLRLRLLQNLVGGIPWRGITTGTGRGSGWRRSARRRRCQRSRLTACVACTARSRWRRGSPRARRPTKVCVRMVP